jgi:hypothetical protein
MLGKRCEVQPILGFRAPVSSWKLTGWHRTMCRMASANRTPRVLDRAGDEVLAGDQEPAHETIGIALASLNRRHDVAFGNTVGEVGMRSIITAPAHNGISPTKDTILDELVFCVVRTALHAPHGNEPNCG